MRSDRAVIEFEDLRFKLARTQGKVVQRQLVDNMTRILKEEMARTTDSLETARRDSRLGDQWEQDYIYTPDTIEEKLKLLRVTLMEQIPAYRKRHGL